MSPAPDAKTGQPNIQDVFLNYVRREKLTVTIRMMDGSEVEGRIKNFDRFAVIVEVSGADQLDWLTPYNKRMAEFSDNGLTLYGAYGPYGGTAYWGGYTLSGWGRY